MTAKHSMTPKQKAFIAEYLVDLNATGAAIRAGFSPRTAKEQAYKLMKLPGIKKAIDTAMKERGERVQTSSDDVLREIQRLAMFDPAELIGVKSPDDIAALHEDVRRAIVGWSWDRQGRFTIKLAKEGALEMLAKHFGLYEADNRQKGELTLKKTAADMTDDELVAIAQKGRNGAAKS